MPKWMDGPCSNQTLLTQKWWTSLSPRDIIWCPVTCAWVHTDQWGWEAYILLRDNITAAHTGLSRIQRAENVVLYWAVMGPGETSGFFFFFSFFKRKRVVTLGDTWQRLQLLNWSWERSAKWGWQERHTGWDHASLRGEMKCKVTSFLLREIGISQLQQFGDIFPF